MSFVLMQSTKEDVLRDCFFLHTIKINGVQNNIEHKHCKIFQNVFFCVVQKNLFGSFKIMNIIHPSISHCLFVFSDEM